MTTAVIVGAYLIGSVPFAFLLARRRGVDLRTAGSGNVGASNVLRTSGVSLAIAAMLLDALKGTAAVLCAEASGAGPETVVAAGLVAIVGHVYPVWLRFHGGKGVATAAGAFTLLAPVPLGIAAAMFAVAVVATRLISVGSLTAAVTLPVAAVFTGTSQLVIVGALAAAIVIVERHRGNLVRLLAGTERRVGGA
jgi:acyl phosphate:glycerol-3-phosphate acyltransferase